MFAYNRIPVIDKTIKLCLINTNPITNMFTTELHVFKHQQTLTSNLKCPFYVSLDISNSSRYVYKT